MNTKRNTILFLIAFAITLAACVGAPTPVVATAAPAAPPAPEEFAIGGSNATGIVVGFSAERCENMPVWLLHPDWRGLDMVVWMASPENVVFSTGQVEATYVASGQVFINDRLIEFGDETEVFQLFEDKSTYELDPKPYIDRATEILEGDIAPVEIVATWRWTMVMTAEQAAAGGYSPYDRWDWRVVDAKCSRLEVAGLKPTREPYHPHRPHKFN